LSTSLRESSILRKPALPQLCLVNYDKKINLKEMVRLKALSPEQATGKTKELFNAIQSKFGVIPNMMRTMGNSPAFLEGYLNFSNALSGGTLGAKTSALIALAVSETNACHYCLAAHSYVGATFGNLDEETMLSARLGNSKNAKTDAILKFAMTLVNNRGHISDADLETLKSAGVTESETAEIAGHVALNILTNYFNIMANTEFDFPVTVSNN
jgi:uncharacterized peroxidase-related enzyme